jgi:hypothetical protein
MGQLTAENARILNNHIKSIPKAIRDTMEGTRAAALDRLEKQLEDAVKSGALPEPMKDSTADVLKEYSQQAADHLNLVNTTMLQSSLNQYARAVQLTAEEERRAAATQAILNQAAGDVNLGVETRETALRKAIGQIAAEGLTGFYDRAGRRWTPEAYVNMDIRTTVHNTAIQSVKNRMQDFNTSVFQVSSHAAARPLCYPYQGKFYSWDNTAGQIELGDGRTVSYEPLNSTSYGMPAGLFGINCGHYPIPVVPGVTIPHGADNIQPEKENDAAYAESQKQRALERDIRAKKRVLEMAGDLATDEQKDALKRSQEKMRQFIAETGRTRRYDRERIGGTQGAKLANTQRHTAPTTPPAPMQPTAPAFTPAKTIADAEAYARKFTNADSAYTKIDYSKSDIDFANEMNRAMNDVLSAYTPKYPLTEIVPMNMRKNEFKGTNADAAYKWSANKLYYNPNYFKSQKAMAAHAKEADELFNKIMPSIDGLIAKKEKETGYGARKQVEYLTALKNTGRTNVAKVGDVHSTVVHEMGHYLDDTVFGSRYKPAGFDMSASFNQYAKGISAYATTSHQEYVAESFLAYWKGERNILDPALVAIFDGARTDGR